MVKNIFFSFILFCLIVNTIQGQDSLNYNMDMDKLSSEDLIKTQKVDKKTVFTASRSSQDVEDVPLTVYVVSREEIINNGYTTLVDVLKSVPGIRVSQPGSAIEGETFIMRGSIGNYYAKIMINNIPIQPSAVSGMPIGEQLPIRQAERIEIVFGPSAAVYGADAMAGVINIITKSVGYNVFSQADLTVGEYGYNHLNAMFGGTLGKNKNILKYTLFASNSSKRDMDIKYDKELYNPLRYDSTFFLRAKYYKGEIDEPLFSDLSNQSRLLGFNIAFRGVNVSHYNMYRREHSSIGTSPAVYSYANPRVFWGESIQSTSLNFTKKLRKVTSTINLSYLSYAVDNMSSFQYINDFGDQGNTYTYAASHDLFAEEILTWQIFENFEILGGLSYQKSGNLPKTNDLTEPFNTDLYTPFSESIDYVSSKYGRFGINPITFSNQAAFVQTYLHSKYFNLIISGRHDNHSIYGNNINPRIAGLIKPVKNIFLRASYGTAFRPPSSYYMYNSVAHTSRLGGVDYSRLPNYNLKPEKIRVAEYGMKYTITPDISIDVSGFYNKTKDYIYKEQGIINKLIYDNADNNTAFYFVNDTNSSSSIYGYQTVVQYKNIIPKIKLNVNVFYSIFRGAETSLGDSLEIVNKLRNMPLQMGQINISFSPTKRFYVNVRGVFSGGWYRRYTPENKYFDSEKYPNYYVNGYYTIDLVSRYEINNNFQIYFKVVNLLDAHYGGIGAYGDDYDLWYNPQNGRNIHVGVSFRMN